MKILAFSDLHRNKEAAQIILEASSAADIVIGAGDFATQGVGLRDTLDILRRIVRTVLLVPGNHDDPAELEAFCRDWKEAHLLHGTGVTIDDIDFFGVGFAIPSRVYNEWNQGLEEPDAVNLFAGCRPGAVLVTHSPPHGVADLQTTGVHEGSRTILDAVRRLHPRLHLFGHIHNSWGQSGEIDGCLAHNLGPSANWFEI